MGSTTPRMGLPYPFGSDVPDGAAQIQALAEAVDDDLHAQWLPAHGTYWAPAGAVGNNVAVPIAWAGADSEHECGASGAVITVARTGLWTIAANVAWAGNANGRRSLTIRVGGTDHAITSEVAGAGVTIGQSAALVIPLNAGATVEVVAFQDSGAALNLTWARVGLAWVGGRAGQTPSRLPAGPDA